MDNKYYDKCKYAIQIFTPALIGLVAGLGSVYGFDTDKIVMTLSLLNVFAGTLLGISSVNYNKKLLDNMEVVDSGKEN